MPADEPDPVQLPHLETFARAAELGSFTGAAKALGLTQAAVSQRIQALEKSLDRSLFERKGGRVLLTDAGRMLYAYVQRILDLHREARKEIAGQETPLVGELALAASSVPGEYLLPTLLADLSRKYPHLRVRAAVSDSMAVLAQVERGDVHLGLAGRKIDDPHLEFRFLARDELVFVAAPDHPSARKKKTSVDRLAAIPLVLREAGSGLRHCLEQALERVGRSLSEFRIALELGSNEAIKKAVLQGVGLAVLSRHAVDEELQRGTLKRIVVEGLHCDRDMFIVLDRRRVLPLPARLFLHFLEAHPIASPS